jgi:hypothetical protein
MKNKKEIPFRTDREKKFCLTYFSVFFMFLCPFPQHAARSRPEATDVHIRKNVLTLRELIAEIEAQTDLLFVFSKDDINTGCEMKIETESHRIGDILEDAFEGSDISCKLVERYVVLRKKPEDGAGRGSRLPFPSVSQQERRITGTVTYASGEPVVGANVVEKGTINGSVTDADGRFTLPVAPGSILVVS